jgi:hypothetical protein
MNTQNIPMSDLIGAVFVSIDGAEVGSKEIRFTTDKGEVYTMFHEQDCCEQVFIEDVIGDVADLLNNPILKAHEAVSTNEQPVKKDSYLDDSNTWTFYHLSTIKGTVTLRWWGSSNGYYSESVQINLEKNP